MSPAYGFSALALVKCSNEGGPGPRHNMKEDPGTSTLTPLPQPEYHWRPASEKTHFGLRYKIRGHGMGKRRMRRPL